MSHAFYKACSNTIPNGYVKQAEGADNAITNLFVELIEKGQIPDDGWSDSTIETFLSRLADMDSNNFPGNIGVGEREGRIYSSLVQRRHYRLAHGIGRSGDLTAIQPKAAGSSLLNTITNRLVLHSLKIAGVTDCQSCFVVPMATGMALTLCMQTFRTQRPDAKYVLWPRIDQKSCFKSIATAGFTAVVIENNLKGDQLNTNMVAITDKIADLGAENILCIMTTTSCFAPRAVDSVEEVGKLAKTHNIPHLINNAYGVQSSKCMHVIQQAQKVGRVDAFVQSTDKNFMVPVGGAIVAGFDKKLIDSISQTYPGRASATPSIDLFITLMSLGVSGFRKLLSERKSMYLYLKERVDHLAECFGERLLQTSQNPISMGITLSPELSPVELTEIGSMLFTRNVSGLRVVTTKDTKSINGHSFIGFGSHHNKYPVPYMTVAAAMGMCHKDVDVFCKRLQKVFEKVHRRSKCATLLEPSTGLENKTEQSESDH